MEEKLARFRAQKQQTTLKDKLYNILVRANEPSSTIKDDCKVDNDEQHSSNPSFWKEANSLSPSSPTKSRISLLVKLMIWTMLFIASMVYEFALMYCLISAFYLIYMGTAGSAKWKKTELSAYSVFNPNCVRLEGTFTAEQFENELLRRPLNATK